MGRVMNVVVIDPWHFTPPYDSELCRGLVDAGHQVLFVRSGDHSGKDESVNEEVEGVRTLTPFSLPNSQLPRSLQLVAKGFQHIRGMFSLYGTLRRLKPDVIHFQWLSLPLFDALFLPFFKRIAPLVLTVHDSNPYNGAGPWLLRAGNAVAMDRCDQFIVHNKVSVERLEQRGVPSDRIHHIAHGLLEKPAADDLKKPERSDPRIHLLQFGKIKEYKGTDVLLNALSLLNAEERTKCSVSIVGRPYIDTQPLLDLVATHNLQDVVNLRFDFVDDAEMIDLFDRTDFLVFPYRDIDTSGVLMVAVARGIPVIASDIGCFSEALTDGDEGRLVPAGDPEQLAHVIKELIASPEHQLQMAGEMKALRRRIPSWEAIAEMTTVVYEQAQPESPSQPLGVHT